MSLFFIYYDGDPRDLPSFPTRRSSDLGSARLRPADGARPATLLRAAERCARRLPAGEGHHRLIRRRDRKSTRLNSSHVEISYAVFCLKKKIKTKASYALAPQSKPPVVT